MLKKEDLTGPKIKDNTVDLLKSLPPNKLKEVSIMIRSSTLTANAPQNPTELYKCIQVVFGVSIPYKAVSTDTVAPYQWVSDVFFGKAPTSFAIANRGGSKTYYGYFLHYLLNTFRPGYSSRHAAAILEQSKVTQGYLKSAMQDPVLADPLSRAMSVWEANWKNGSSWRIITGSAQGISGQHPNAAFFDEIEFWKMVDIEQSWAVPVSRGGHPAIWAGFSTRQRGFGAANKLANIADERGIKVYKWNIFETLQRCKTCIAIDQNPYGTDADRQLTCNLWEDCYGKKGTQSTGWVKLKNAQELKQKMSTESWRTQGICDKPTTKGKVLHNFEHISRLQGGNLTTFDYDMTLPLYCAHDPAEGKESCLYFLQIIDNDIYVFDELIQSQCSNTSETKAAFYKMCQEKGYKDPELIIVDPRKMDSVADWRGGSRNGVGIGRKYNAIPSPTDKANGGQEIFTTIEFLRKQIADGNGTRNLFVNPKKCPQLLEGITEYHYPMDDSTNEIKSDTPSKEYSDRIDPLRYFVQWYQFVYRKGNRKLLIL